MLRIQEIIQSITNQTAFSQQIYIIDGIIRNQEGNDSKKNQSRTLLMILSDIINDKSSLPKSKYYCVKIVKYFADKRYPNFISDLAYSALYQDLVRLAKTVDPEKPTKQKGRQLFPENPQLGNRYIVLIEKGLVEWANSFPINQKAEPSKFKKSYQQLKKLQVVLPDVNDIDYDAYSSPATPVPQQYARNEFGANEFPALYRQQDPQLTFQNKQQSNYYNILGSGQFKREPQADLNNFFQKIQKPSPFNAIKKQLNEFPQRLSKKTSSLTKYHKQNKSISKYNIMNNSGKSQDLFFGQNIRLDKNDYDGTIVSNTLPYWQQISQMDKQQIKRFKSANFKDKSILYQDNYIQIGFKSKLIYQNVDAFKMFLKIILYYDNKGSSDITNLSNQFNGDKTNVLYSTSKRIDSRIISEDHITQELLIIRTTILMNLIQMKVNYTCNGQNRSINILLPNTDITATDLSKKMDQRKSSIFRTDPFKLSKHFPPKVVKKNLQGFIELTSYNAFEDQKSYVQYELGGHLQIAKINDYLVRIIIRIDMKAVIQVLPIQSKQQSIQQSMFYGKFLLQTLQFLLQEDSI